MKVLSTLRTRLVAALGLDTLLSTCGYCGAKIWVPDRYTAILDGTRVHIRCYVHAMQARRG